MIQASKANLITKFYAGTVTTRYMEIEYFLLVLGRLTSIAGVIAGFSGTALVSLAGYHSYNSLLLILYILTTGSALGLMLVVLVVSTLTRMWGPGLALRGDGPECLETAVETMESSVHCAFRVFIAGLSFFLLSALVSTWMRFDVAISLICSILMIYAFRKIYFSGKDIISHLWPLEITSGNLRGNPFKRQSTQHPKDFAKTVPQVPLLEEDVFCKQIASFTEYIDPMGCR